MNTESAAKTFVPDERELISALIKICGFTAESLSEIRLKMDQEHMSFVDACLNLRIATQEQVGDAIAAAHAHNQQGTSLLQVAIRRASGSRELVVSEAQGTATPSKILDIAYDPYSARGEKIRALRTELFLRNEHKNKARGAIIVVAGANSLEGRSLLCAELAIAFSQAGKRTLIVDCNLRKPQQHILFECDNQSGLSDALSQNITKPFYYAVNMLQNLYLLTSGPTVSNPLELLSNPKLSALVSGWERSFDYILLDTPAISDFSDTLAITAIAGNVLLVSRAKHSNLKDCKNMMRRLSSTQATILGAVINHF
jgi:capsular exopolysaccharide synthesis family protein